ncbi:hypothetical protein V8G54_030460 [Vigna mungo]|uniref:Uncharacterized protein n=1 Tax=Vigna mungo TaxID=3915 RepID=A0AAQ3MX40_VIGMU
MDQTLHHLDSAATTSADKPATQQGSTRHPLFRGVRKRRWENGCPKSGSRARSLAYGSALSRHRRWQRRPTMSQPTASRAARRNSISPTRSTASRAPSACTACDMQVAAAKAAHMMIVQTAAAAPDCSK